MPLSALGELIEFANSEEQRLEKTELEKQLFPLWIVNYALCKLNGTEIMSFEDFVNQTLKPDVFPTPIRKSRTEKDIISELMPLVEADRQRGG